MKGLLMFCPFCGFHIAAEDCEYCPHCGKSLDVVKQRRDIEGLVQATALPQPSVDADETMVDATWALQLESSDAGWEPGEPWNPSQAPLQSSARSSHRALIIALFAVIGLVVAALGAQLGVLLLGVLPIDYFQRIRMAGWGVCMVGVVLSVVIAVVQYDDGRERGGERQSRFGSITAVMIAGTVVVALCLVNTLWANPRAMRNQSQAVADCSAEYQRFAEARKNALPDNGLDRLSVHDFRKSTAARDAIRNQSFSCPENASARQLQSVSADQRAWVAALPHKIDAIRKSLKSRDEYTLDDIVKAGADGSYRAISGKYCRVDDVCWGIGTDGKIERIGMTNKDDWLQSGSGVSTLSVVRDRNVDNLHQHNVGLTLMGPEDEAKCVQGSGSDCDNAPNYEMLSYRSVVWYFRKGVAVDDLRQYGCSGRCSDNFVPPDTSRPFLLIPLMGGTVAAANEPSDQRVFYLQDDVIYDMLGCNSFPEYSSLGKC
ncbi:hypothetical protein DF196_05175 [Bifidobacterium callitrichidarum]|uniref:Uncharacterized protein n=2 Tax=Bifidobacterium callitrichidarum TaxID=2052941 RepID=A0A2U2NAC7_9BIFI|nr:hypothetical protein DF196_05175 [Bifidobacterium callitrichidarum]